MKRPRFEMSADTKIIRSVMQECKVGDTITYESLTLAIGRDVRKHANASLQSARRSLMNDQQMVFDCIPNVGYKRLADGEIVSASERDRSSLVRRSGKAIKQLSCAKFDALTDEEKVKHTTSAAQFGAVRALASSKAARAIEDKTKRVDSSTLSIGDTLKLFTNGEDKH